jgi:hypothetical protein
MRETIAHRRSARLVAAALLLAFAGVLGGCSGLAVPSWDPTDMLDFLDTKKKAPGERKPVFPEGVPGISQGVPKDLVRGSPEARAAAEANVTPPVETQPAPPPAKRARTAAKQPAGQAPVEIAPDDVNVEDEQQPPPPRRQAQRPQRSQPQTEQQANPFPTPR